MKIIVKVVLIAFLWIAIIDQGILGTNGDTATRLQMANAWWTGTEEVKLPTGFKPTQRGFINVGVKGVDGRRYVTYDVGQSMLMLPGDWVGTQLHPWLPMIPLENLRQLAVSFLIFVPLNVAAVAACFYLLRLFDFDERISGLASITWLLSTTVLHYAQIHFQNNQVLLFAIIGYAAALAYVRSARPRFALISGLALGAAMLVRLSAIVHVVTVLLFLLGCVAYQSRDRVKVLKSAALWILGLIPLIFLGRAFDYIRYGSFWTTGQSLAIKEYHNTTDPIWAGLPEFPANYPFTVEPLRGFFAVLLSPTKSIFVYDPLLLPCLILGFLLWKKFSPYVQWYLVTAILNLLLHMVMTSRFDYWHGEWSWGARYHVTSVHLLLIPLIAVFIKRLFSSRKLASQLMGSVLAIAILIQFGAVSMPYSLEIVKAEIIAPKATRNFQFRLGQRFTNIACLFNSSFSEECINESTSGKLSPQDKNILNRDNRLAFLPFHMDQIIPNNPELLSTISPLVLSIWGLILASTFTSTIWFFATGFRNLRDRNESRQ